MTTFAELVISCPDEDVNLIRELLSYDSLCPICCTFSRNSLNQLVREYTPSPLHWSRQVEWPWIIKHANLTGYETVLDVGGGWSVLKYALAKRCRWVWSLEIDQEFIDRTVPSIHKLGFHNISQVQGDAVSIPFTHDFFDHVVCCSVLEHVQIDHLHCLDEMVRVLKPGGRLLLTLDVAYERKGATDFFIGREEASQILALLGANKEFSNGMTAYVDAGLDKQIPICTLMICYTKGT